MRVFSFGLLVLAMSLSVGCNSSDFAGGSAGRTTSKNDKASDKRGSDDDIETDDNPPGDDNSGDEDIGGDDDKGGKPSIDAEIAALEEESISTTEGSVKAGRCSPDYTVGGQSNIFLAGTPDGTKVSYKKGAPDRAPGQSPLLVVPDVQKCFRPGAKLFFKVSGQISHGANPATNADGRIEAIYNHERGAIHGKSDIRAPLNALVGVFLPDGDPSGLPSPETLSFATQTERDYKTLSPQAGQVFFIGDGKNASGDYQNVIVPDGVSRLYFGVMDVFEWNNNSGSLTGAILIEK